MARVKPDQPLTPSLLDRLSDSAGGGARGQGQLLRELKQSVRIDLENLLNTRRRCVGWPDHLRELDKSLTDYGIPDLTGSSLSSKESRERFCRIIESTIRRFEPRFRSVEVRLMDENEPLQRTLNFQIDALLRVEPVPEPVVFDTSLEPLTGTFEVRGGR